MSDSTWLDKCNKLMKSHQEYADAHKLLDDWVVPHLDEVGPMPLRDRILGWRVEIAEDHAKRMRMEANSNFRVGVAAGVLLFLVVWGLAKTVFG